MAARWTVTRFDLMCRPKRMPGTFAQYEHAKAAAEEIAADYDLRHQTTEIRISDGIQARRFEPGHPIFCPLLLPIWDHSLSFTENLALLQPPVDDQPARTRFVTVRVGAPAR